jgi:Fe-S oxidoreductase
VLGLEPSCLFTLKDELPALLSGEDSHRLASRAMLLEEFLVAEYGAGRIDPARFSPIGKARAVVHGHCHQKAFGAAGATEKALRLVPGLEVSTITSSCCGMAGSFGYEAEHLAISRAMAEQSLLPAIRGADDDTLIVADGFSCRHQIRDGAGREAIHVAGVLRKSLG